MKKTLIAALAGAFALTANAGDYSKEVTEVIEVDDSIGATLSAGYDSRYIFRGVDNGKNAVSVGLDYGLAVMPDLVVDLGAFYINPTGGSGVNPYHGDELQLSAISTFRLAVLTSGSDTPRISFPRITAGPMAARPMKSAPGSGLAVGPVDFGLGAYYDFDIEGWYFDLTGSYDLAVADGLDLVLTAGISYESSYYGGGSDFNSVLLMASLPIELTSTATLTPYIAGTISLDAIDYIQDDQLFGGVSLSVSF